MRLQGTPRGPVCASLTFAPMGTPLGQRLLQASLSVLGYVEADKENGENLWAIPSVPAVPSPGDAPFPLPPLGQRRERLGPTRCLLCPILYP